MHVAPVTPLVASLTDVLSFVGLITALVLAAIGAIATIGVAMNKSTSWVLIQVENTVETQGATLVPALFTFVGTVGLESSGFVLPELPAFLVGVGVAAVTLFSAILAQDKTHRLGRARWLAVVGLIAPFAIAVFVALTSADLAQISIEYCILLVGSGVIGIVGLIVSVVLLRDQYTPGQ
jgi:hypothetical protein